MKFQDSSFNGLKVTVGTKSVTHAPTHARTHARSKSNMPHQLFQSWGHNNLPCGFPTKLDINQPAHSQRLTEPRCEKTGFLHMRKQRRRSASR